MAKLQIINGNSLTELKKINDNSVDFIITSPPYWNLKDYNNNHQIGFHQSYDSYLLDLFKILDSAIEKLKYDRFIAINIGDVTNSIEIQIDSKSQIKKKYFINSIQANIINHYYETSNIKLFRHIIWHKGKASCNSRGPYYDDHYYPRFIYPQFDYEHILIFYKIGQTFKPTLCKELSNEPLNRIPTTLYKTLSSSIWEIDYEKDLTHDAVMPEELAIRLIKLFTLKNEIILDPFMGRGTSLKMGLALERNVIGIELNKDYIDYFNNDYIHRKINSTIYYQLLDDNLTHN